MLDRKETTVISPCNDGESKTIIQICRNLEVDVRVSPQAWGSTLENEPPENLRNLKKNLLVVEMPSPKAEQQLRQRHNLYIIDHHFYPKINLDRRQPLSSLEQVAELLGYELNRWEKGVAINDRSYIFGLLDAGYSVEEILKIRRFDLEAQGVEPEKIETVQKALKSAPVRNGITILKLPFTNAGFAQDFLVLENPDVVKDLLILGGDPIRKVQFYGDPKKIALLEDIGEWTGGGEKSRFWGTNHPDLSEIFRRLGIDEHGLI